MVLHVQGAPLIGQLFTHGIDAVAHAEHAHRDAVHPPVQLLYVGVGQATFCLDMVPVKVSELRHRPQHLSVPRFRQLKRLHFCDVVTATRNGEIVTRPLPVLRSGRVRSRAQS